MGSLQACNIDDGQHIYIMVSDIGHIMLGTMCKAYNV